MPKSIYASKNVPNWQPSETDYCLVFCECEGGMFRECSHNVPKYSMMTLADYLREIDIVVPDYCQFMRVIRPDMHFEYRAFGNRVRIDVNCPEWI